MTIQDSSHARERANRHAYNNENAQKFEKNQWKNPAEQLTGDRVSI